MRHQTKRKYADRKKLNRKYHSQKAYRKEQKRKTGWRARRDKDVYKRQLLEAGLIYHNRNYLK